MERGLEVAQKYGLLVDEVGVGGVLEGRTVWYLILCSSGWACVCMCGGVEARVHVQ